MLKQEIEKYLGQIATDPNHPGEGSPAKGDKKMFTSNDEANSYLGERINGSLTSGDPKQIRVMFQTARGLYGDKVAHELLDQVVIHNQRTDMKGKSNEDKISSFYEIVHGSPELEKMKGKISSIGYGPVAHYLSTEDNDIKETRTAGKDIVKAN